MRKLSAPVRQACGRGILPFTIVEFRFRSASRRQAIARRFLIVTHQKKVPR